MKLNVTLSNISAKYICFLDHSKWFNFLFRYIRPPDSVVHAGADAVGDDEEREPEPHRPGPVVQRQTQL